MEKKNISASRYDVNVSANPFPVLHKDFETIFFNVLHAHDCALGGTNTGVMKHVGEAVKEQEITFGSEDKVNVIGIATWGIVDRKDSLIGKVERNSNCFVFNSKPMLGVPKNDVLAYIVV